MRQSGECSKCESGFCQIRNRALPEPMRLQCAAGNSVSVDILLSHIDESRKLRVDNRKPIPRRRALAPREKVGTALKARIEKLITIKTGKGCGCQNLATKMDTWGIAGCEQRREEIVSHLVSNREILTEALKTHGTLGHAAGLAIEFIPDMMLRAGAGVLLDAAINDARTQQRPVRATNRARVVRPRTTQGKTPPAVRSILPMITPRPFTAKPRLTLLCHCWPNGNNWRRHVEYLQAVDGVFDRKIMGVATGKGTSTFAEVRAAFGESWEYFEVANDPKQREGATYKTMLQMAQTTDDNDVTFCIHTKGTQDGTASSDQIRWWTEAMYSTVVYNWKNVLLKMEQGCPIIGSFVRNGNYLGTRHRWHFSGTFYALRNVLTFANGVPALDNKWYATESWPGHHFAKHEVACMFADNCGDIYKVNHELEQALNEWKRLNET